MICYFNYLLLHSIIINTENNEKELKIHNNNNLSYSK